MLLGTEFILSHTFQCERYFSFACPGNFEKYHKGDFAGHCSIKLFRSGLYIPRNYGVYNDGHETYKPSSDIDFTLTSNECEV